MSETADLFGKSFDHEDDLTGHPLADRMRPSGLESFHDLKVQLNMLNLPFDLGKLLPSYRRFDIQFLVCAGLFERF